MTTRHLACWTHDGRVPPVTYPSGIPMPEFDAPDAAAEVIILTGMSGAGRTRAAAALADQGWYVVDNLPPQMLGGLVAMVGREPADRLAAVVDVSGAGCSSRHRGRCR